MLNIINNLPEALTLADLPDCLRLLYCANYNLRLRPFLSFVAGERGERELCVGDELTVGRRWWARRPEGDAQRMLPFAGFNRARAHTTYQGRDNYFEVEITPPRLHVGHCPRVLTFQPGARRNSQTLSALRVHGLTAENITELKQQLRWQ